MRKSSFGFTLIEVLLGLTIFSIIALSLYSTFQSGIMINQRAEETNQIYREAKWTMELMSKEMEGMVGYDFSNSYPDRMACEGTKNKISFLSAKDQGLLRVSYFLEPIQAGSVYQTIIGRHSRKNESFTSSRETSARNVLFIREEVPFIDDLQTAAPLKRKKDVLSVHALEGSLRLTYGYVQGQGESAKIVWKDTWDEKYHPSRVTIELTFSNPKKDGQSFTVTKDIFIPTGYLGAEEQ